MPPASSSLKPGGFFTGLRAPPGTLRGRCPESAGKAAPGQTKSAGENAHFPGAACRPCTGPYTEPYEGFFSAVSHSSSLRSAEPLSFSAFFSSLRASSATQARFFPSFFA